MKLFNGVALKISFSKFSAHSLSPGERQGERMSTGLMPVITPLPTGHNAQVGHNGRFGRVPGPGWMPHLLGAAVTDTDPNQRLSDDNCGQISLGWGHVFIFHGYDVAQQC
eukprot:COSAG02_NODE_595_length_19813_cov_12.215380_15_plen_110_part_00